MAKKSIKKNYIYNLSYQIITLITPLIIAPYLSRILGADGIGTYSYTESVCSYFVLFATLGLTTFGQREISYVQEDKKKRSVIFWETNIIELGASLICIAVYILFSFKQSTPWLYLALIPNLLAVIANVSWFFQGMEEFGKIVLRNAAFKVINVFFVFIFIKSRDDLLIYFFGTSILLLLCNMTFWTAIPQYIQRVKLSELHPTKHIKTVLSLFIPTIAIQIYTVLDKTMIGIITQDSFENGYYEQAFKISKMVLTVVTTLGTVMIPRIGSEYNKGNMDEVKRLMYRGYRFVWMLGIPLCFGLITVASNFVPWFFGDGYDKVVLLLGILAFLILAIGINNVTGMQYLIPTKRQNTFTLTVVIGATTNFLMNLILIYLFQSIGAAIASVMAETVITVVQIIIVRKELKPSVIIKEGIYYYLAGVLMVAVLIPLGKALSSSIIHTMVMVVCGTVVYFLALLVMKDEFFVSILKNIIGIVFGKLKRG